jgi:hypothetical protein
MAGIFPPFFDLGSLPNFGLTVKGILVLHIGFLANGVIDGDDAGGANSAYFAPSHTICTMSESAPLFKLLRKPRRNRLADLRAKVASILSNRLHTHFTDHSVAHSDRVVKLAEQLAAPLAGARKLNDNEAFVLYAGAYLHDVGMQNENAGLIGRMRDSLAKEGREWSKVLRDERLDLIRQRHHEISADMVMASVNSGVPLIGLSLAEEDHPSEIASIAEAHCIDTLAERYTELTRRGERPTMRLGLLSAILRLADVLDEAHHRALVDQARTLDLNLESRMHWWRHYYTREVVVEAANNRITIWFGFPLTMQDEYTRIIPPLQMPWVEQELSRHREILAENGLGWHIGWQVQQSPFSSLDPMPPDVKGIVLQELAHKKQLAAEQSRLDVVTQFDEARSHVMLQFNILDGSREQMSADEYLRSAQRLALDLWQIGSKSSAWHRLKSCLHFATTNGRTTSPALHVEIATGLSRMLAEDDQPADALRELASVRRVANSLADSESEKISFYRWLAPIALRAGYGGDGNEAAAIAMKLLSPGAERELLAAELAEARLLSGLEVATGKEGSIDDSQNV